MAQRELSAKLRQRTLQDLCPELGESAMARQWGDSVLGKPLMNGPDREPRIRHHLSKPTPRASCLMFLERPLAKPIN
jgi:hypothetical protein